MKNFLIFTILILSFQGCKKDSDSSEDLMTQKELLEFHKKHPGKKKSPPLPDLKKLNEKYNKQKPEKINVIFPKTLCGELVSKLYRCELELVENNPELKDVFKKDIKNRKTRRFSAKKQQYLAHCRKTVKNLSEKAIRDCMVKNCKEMDACLKKITEKIPKN